MSTVYTYRLIGIKADGTDQIMDIEASCETEAEIIIESFHDGGYQLLSGDWDNIDDIPNEEELEASLYLSLL